MGHYGRASFDEQGGGEDGIMTFEAILDQALAMLQRLGCMTYRSRQR
jgi:hypothetical protein